MKQYLIIALSALVLASCNKKPQKQEQTSETAKTETTIQEVEYKAPEFLSPDLAMQDLAGHVKSMEYTVSECDEKGQVLPSEGMSLFFFFNEKGSITKGYVSTKEEKGPKFIRNEQGQIKQTERMIAELNFTYINSFTYNPDGTVASEKVNGYEVSSQTTYTYDNGVLVSSIGEETGEGMTYKTRNTFKVLEVDSHGSWTKRMCTSDVTYTEQGNPNEEKQTTYAIEERKIEYYL